MYHGVSSIGSDFVTDEAFIGHFWGTLGHTSWSCKISVVSLVDVRLGKPCAPRAEDMSIMSALLSHGAYV